MTESAPLSAQTGGSASPQRFQPPTRAGRASGTPATPLTAAVCPFLVASDGAWRAATPTREHRCGATDPAGKLPFDRQEQLCLVAKHLDCPLFEAAAGLTVGAHLQEAARAAQELDPRAVPASLTDQWREGDDETEAPAFVTPNRSIPRSTPVILDRARPPLDVRLPQMHLPSLSLRRPSIAPAPPTVAGGDTAAPRTRIAELRAMRSRTRERQPVSVSAGSLPAGAAGLTESRALASSNGDRAWSLDSVPQSPALMRSDSSGRQDAAADGGSLRWRGDGDRVWPRDGQTDRTDAPDRPMDELGSSRQSGGSGASSMRARLLRPDDRAPTPIPGWPSGSQAGPPSGTDARAGVPPITRPSQPATSPRTGDPRSTGVPPTFGSSQPAPLSRAADPRTPPAPSATGPHPPSAGLRRFAPPGGPNGFRTLGRLAPPSGGFGGVRAALAGREIQAAIAGLMAVALVLVLVVKLSPGGSAGVAGASSSPRPSGTASATASAGPSGAGGAGASPIGSSPPQKTSAPKPTAKATARPSVRPSTSLTATKTYRVRSGDTLSEIAASHGTTVAALMRLNNIGDPRTLHVGQVLKLP